MSKQIPKLYAAVGLAVGGLVLMWFLSESVGNLWHRLALFYVVMIPAALIGVKLEWKKLFKFDVKDLGYGLIVAGLLYAMGFVGSVALAEIWPDFADEVEDAYAMLADVPGWQMWPLLVFIIAGEEVVWRLGVTLGFADKFKLWAIPLGGLAYAVVHLPWGGPLLILAAFVFGTCWSALAYHRKSFWAPFIAHVGWDVLVLFVAKY